MLKLCDTSSSRSSQLFIVSAVCIQTSVSIYVIRRDLGQIELHLSLHIACFKFDPLVTKLCFEDISLYVIWRAVDKLDDGTEIWRTEEYVFPAVFTIIAEILERVRAVGRRTCSRWSHSPRSNKIHQTESL